MFFYSLLVDHYFSLSNMSNILSQSAPLLVLACGQTLIVLMQGTDLSVGAQASAIGVIWFTFLNMGLPLVMAALLAVLMGACFGFLNGVIAAKGLLPVFIVTLGTQNIFRSTAFLTSHDQTLYYSHPIFRIIAKTGFLGLSWSVWIALGCFLFTWVLLRKTPFGMKVTGIGGNPEALTLSGARISKTTILAFTYTGIMAAIGSLLLCCRIESGNPNAGNGLEFNSIAAVLLGGTSMREGRGGVEGTIFGVLLLQILKSGLTQVGISSIYQNAIIGTVVLFAIILDQILKNVRNRQEVI
ncbi:MAG: ABC transporter permease [Eubacterium sp.]|nr:ABC transporter permease [Eubacterium sp.]